MFGSQEFIERCKKIIVDYFNANKDATDKDDLKEADVYLVWYSKSLQNHKALLSTTVPDGMYYEITYNGDKKEFYLDAYKKWKNKVVPFTEE